MEKTCLKCGNTFIPSKGLNNYCSFKCRQSREKSAELREKLSSKILELKPWLNQVKGSYKGYKWTPEQVFNRKMTLKEKFENNVTTLEWGRLNRNEKRERVLREQLHRCSECSIEAVWNGKVLKFQLDHVDGDRTNNQRSNLRLLCPNCHSQTLTYCVGNNKNPGKIQYSDQDVIESLKTSESAYKAMKKLGMNPHGGNYTRLRLIVKKYNLDLGYYF